MARVSGTVIDDMKRHRMQAVQTASDEIGCRVQVQNTRLNGFTVTRENTPALQ